MTNTMRDLPGDSSSGQTHINQPPIDTSTQQSLVNTNIKSLDEGLELIQMLNAEQFQQCYRPAFESTIGAHFRHILEHYRCFFAQLERGVICYDERLRDDRLENERDYALLCINEILAQLREFNMALFEREFTIKDCQADDEVKTSLERELLFLQSHTVHHYALIAAMTRGLGVQPKAGFGVAIATQKYQDECLQGDQQQHSNENVQAVEKKTCAR